MSIQLTEDQSKLLKQLKQLDPDPIFKGFPEITSSTHIQQPPSQKKQPVILYDVDYDSQHSIIRDKLLRYRTKSQQIYKAGQLIKQYEHNFTRLMQQKNQLIGLIQKMKGTTSQLLQKQKKMIDLSIKIKQTLDYYSYHDKFSFDYPCEINCREMFQNTIQTILSELTDGIQFFQENTTYTQSKKFLGMFQASRSKILSFAKSFFIKLFNKQQSFVLKNSKMTMNGLIDSFYPKSKIKFISTFILHYPQFQSRLENIIKSIKESSKEDEIKFIDLKQMEIYQFQLNRSNLSLIAYLQRFMPQIYDQSILKFFTFYRTTLHQNLTKNPYKKEGNFPQIFAQRLYHMVYVVCCQYTYQFYCCKVSKQDAIETVKSTLTTISKFYGEQLLKLVRDNRNKSPFELCELLTKAKDQLNVFLQDYMKEEYQSYAFGAVSQIINHVEHIQFLKNLFTSYLKRLLVDMQTLCYNSLPKFVEVKSKKEIEQAVRQFLIAVPKLKYCQNQAERYLISALDSIVKSIKEVNSKMQSRFQCYIWNLQLFGNIKYGLKNMKGNLIRKQLRLDVNNSTNIFQRFRSIQRNDSFVKYAQEIFNVIKTGMPVINQLTLDFNKYILEHSKALESQFVKDILFIYAKNMIEFLHNLTDASEEDAKNICSPQIVQNLYSTFILSIEKYVKDANMMIKDWRSYKVGNQSEQIILLLLNEVYERLFDLLDRFYVQSSKLVSTQKFKQIEALKQAYKKNW